MTDIVHDMTRGRKATKSTWFLVIVSHREEPSYDQGECETIAKFKAKGDAFNYAISLKSSPDYRFVSVQQ
jgi:hypothetical protein